jgi:hypothetical protein
MSKLEELQKELDALWDAHNIEANKSHLGSRKLTAIGKKMKSLALAIVAAKAVR